MKLKTVFAASLLVSGVAFADSTDVTTGYTIGVLPLSISTTEALISVPWVESGSTSDGVAVTNFIKTAGLKTGASGDLLFWYDTANKKYAAWYINDGAWSSLASEEYETMPNSMVLKRGESVLMKLKNENLPRKVYVVGQVSDASASTTIAGGTSDSPAFTLLASPNLSTPVAVNTKFTKSIAVDGDAITYLNGSTVSTVVAKMVGSEIQWGYYSWTSAGEQFNEVKNISIPAGQGFWYRRCSTETSVTW